MSSIPLRAIAVPAVVLAIVSAPAARAEEAPRGNGGAPVSTDLDGRGGALSDKLGSSDGVIHPRGDVDPTMRRPAPATGSMPVVKPGAVAPGTAK